MPCKYWREYESIAGMVGYCEAAAFHLALANGQVWPRGCSAEMKTVCLCKMVYYHGLGSVPGQPEGRYPVT